MLKHDERIFKQTLLTNSLNITKRWTWARLLYFFHQSRKDELKRSECVPRSFIGCLPLVCASFRTATCEMFSAHASLSREAAPMTGWSTAQPFCPAAPFTPTLCLPFQWLSAATVVPAGRTAMSARTEPAWMEPGVVNQSDEFILTLDRATTWSHFKSSAFPE